jgi:hypothetical protein
MALGFIHPGSQPLSPWVVFGWDKGRHTSSCITEIQELTRLSPTDRTCRSY